MNDDAHPAVEAQLKALRPTQMTLGYAEVAEKRKQWQKRTAKEAKRFLRDHRFPAIRGPGDHYYIIDHHHLGRALIEEKVGAVIVAVVADLSYVRRAEFWTVMEYRGWVHCYDTKGVRRDFAEIPKKLKKLPDDPYRSLAAAVRRAGDYPKDATPFSEFLWADFFRRRISAAALRKDSDGALKRALRLLEKPDAAYLPDWSRIGKS